MTAAERKYLDELAADLAKHGGIFGDPAQAIKSAHERRQKFAKEMLSQTTRRSILAKMAIGESVFIACNVRASKQKLIDAGNDFERSELVRATY